MESAVLERTAPKFSWSEITCGEGCWTAKEDDCHCSCGGKNHGIWRTDKTANVQRTRKIKGTLYKLVSVGTRSELYEAQYEMLKKYGIMRCYDYYGNGEYSHQTYADQLRCRGDKDSLDFPVIMENAKDNEIERWKELHAFKNHETHNYNQKIALLWEIFVIPAPCKHTCQNAKSIKEK